MCITSHRHKTPIIELQRLETCRVDVTISVAAQSLL